MRILQLGGLAGPGAIAGGVWRVAEHQSHLLRAAGHEVDLVGSWLGDNVPTPAPGKTLLKATQLLPRAGLKALYVTGIEQVLIRGSYDVAHVHLSRDYMTTHALSLLQKKGIPIVAQSHGMIGPSQKGSVKLFDLAFGSRIRTVPAIWLSLTDQERASLSNYGVEEHKIASINNFVPDTSTRWGAIKSTTFLFASRLHRRKHPEVCVQATDALLQDGFTCGLELVGPDEGSAAEVDALIKRSKREDHIKYLGPQPPSTVNAKLQKCLAMVLPSENEIAPMIVIESAALGTPFILTDDSGLSKTVSENMAGLVVKPNVSDVRAAMQTLLEDRGLARKLSINARALYESEWSGQRALIDLERAYAKALLSTK